MEVPLGMIQEHVGPRPVREVNRKAMVAQLFQKLDALDKRPPQPTK